MRSELVTLPAAFALSAAILWVVGPRGQRLRRGWSVLDHIAAALVLVAVLLVLNRIAGPHASQWHTVTTSWRGRMWSLGMQATEALALGLGLFPLIGGLASLWIPERRHDPHWRAFAAFTGRSDHHRLDVHGGEGGLSVHRVRDPRRGAQPDLPRPVAPRGHGRLALLAQALASGNAARRGRSPPGSSSTTATSSTTRTSRRPATASPPWRTARWHWDQPTIRIGLAVASAVLLVVVLVIHAPRVSARTRNAVIVLVAAATVSWMLTAEITSANGSASGSKAYADGLAKPLDWIDRATGRSPTTFIGQNISSGDALGIDMLEFWNRSLKNIWSLDGSAPGPGGTLTPDLATRYGTLTSDPGFDYALTTNDVDLVGPVVARRPGVTLRRIVHHPWALRQSVYGVSNDGWISAPRSDGHSRRPLRLLRPRTDTGNAARGRRAEGILLFDRPTRPHRGAGRTCCARSATRTRRRPRPADGAIRAAELLREVDQLRLSTPPVAVQVSASPTFSPIDYGVGDNRHLGAQVGFSFSPKR